MSQQNMPLTNKISQSSSLESQPALLKCRFGNGYEQRAPDGINYESEIWNITWENITGSELTYIKSVILATRRGSDPLIWQAPGNTTTKKYVYEGQNVTALAGDIYNITIKVREVFDI